MKVAKLAAGAGLEDPAGAGWKDVAGETVGLSPVPLEEQPNAYIQETWKDRPYGQTAEAKVAAASDGERLYVRLEWKDDGAPNGEFHDAAGAMFPRSGGGAVRSMGSSDSPVGMWFWEDGRSEALEIESSGPGVFKRQPGDVSGAGALSDGVWSVVLSGPVNVASAGGLGVAVWNGSNEERAGLAAVSREWISLEN
ncbi:MAG: ethylbenzene dehydrogenase-related protein [Dehalococcoidia bacterium]